MGSFSSKMQADGSFEPSSFARWYAVPSRSNYKATAAECNEAEQVEGAKVLVVCTDNGRLKMANGKVFKSGTHPTEMFVPLLHFKAAGFAFEFATFSGKRVVLEMWSFPKKDAAVAALYQELKPQLEKPLAIEAVNATDYAGIFIPGGHGACVNLPDSAALGNLLHQAHSSGLPTIAICHGPAALLAASKVDGKAFPYEGYRLVSFSDRTDRMSPSIGFMPGQMPWMLQKTLKAAGLHVLNTSEKGATHVDRELITGDSPGAANALGVIACPIIVAFAKAHQAR